MSPPILHNLSSSSAGGAGASQNFLTETILTNAPMDATAGSPIFASATYQNVVFTADFSGGDGNNINLVFTGANTIAAAEATWDGGNAGNTVSFNATNYRPPAGTLVLSGGVDMALSSILEGLTGVTFTSSLPGTTGDGAALVFDGIEDINTVVANYNAAPVPAGNVISHDGTGIEVPATITVTTAGGIDVVASSGTYDTQTYLADVSGTTGDAITLNFNGSSDTFTSALTVWNGANIGNEATRTTGDGLIVLNASTLFLTGGFTPFTGILTPARITDDWVLLSYEIFWINGSSLDGNWVVEVCNDTNLGDWVPLNGLDAMIVDTDSDDIHVDVSYINWRFIRLKFVLDGGSGGLATVVLNVRA